MFLLYADGPSNDPSSRSSGPTGTNSWPGIYGRDGTSNYTIPYPQIIYASNVNEPGFWIFKLDSHIIGGAVSGDIVGGTYKGIDNFFGLGRGGGGLPWTPTSN